MTHLELSVRIDDARSFGLACSAELAQAMNGILRGVRVAPVEMEGGGHALCADLLTDAATYGPVIHMLEELPLVPWEPKIEPE
jgi:hypothetical protein